MLLTAYKSISYRNQTNRAWAAHHLITLVFALIIVTQSHGACSRFHSLLCGRIWSVCVSIRRSLHSLRGIFFVACLASVLALDVPLYITVSIQMWVNSSGVFRICPHEIFSVLPSVWLPLQYAITFRQPENFLTSVHRLGAWWWTSADLSWTTRNTQLI